MCQGTLSVRRYLDILITPWLLNPALRPTLSRHPCCPFDPFHRQRKEGRELKHLMEIFIWEAGLGCESVLSSVNMHRHVTCLVVAPVPVVGCLVSVMLSLAARALGFQFPALY